MTEDTNTIDTTAQVLDTPETVKTPVEESQPEDTLKIDTIFGELYNELKASVKQFLANLCIAGMEAEQAVAHTYEHAKTLVAQYHQTPLNDAQRSVLTAQLLRDANDPSIPVDLPIGGVASNPVETSTPEVITPSSDSTEQPSAQQTPIDTTQQAPEPTQEPASTPEVATPVDPGTPPTGQAVTDFVEESH